MITTLHISLALLLATLSLSASITLLTTFPARQEASLRRFFVAWVAVSGAIFWLMASALLVRLFRGRSTAKSESLDPASSRRVEPTGGAKYFKNGTRVPTISRPIPQTLTCNTIPTSSMPSTTTTSSLTSPSNSPCPPHFTSSRRNLLMPPCMPPELPSVFSPFSFHPPDEGSLYPQHQPSRPPPRSDSLAALMPASTPPTTTPPKSTFDEILSECAEPSSPSPDCERSSLASTVSDVSSSASLRRCVSHRLLAPPPEAHVPARKTDTTASGWSPGQNLKDVQQQVMAKSGKSLPLLPGDDGPWYRCHLKEGGAGHRLSTSSI